MSPVQVQKDQLLSQLYPNLYHHEVPKSGTGAKRLGRGRMRSNKGEGSCGGEESLKKKKLTNEQVNILEVNFGIEHKLETERKEKLALQVDLDPRQVAVWFQNRRARWKIKKLDEKYSNLKTLHGAAVVEKCRLEAEVMKLKEQLCQAENEIDRLSKRSDATLAASIPSSALLTDTNQKEFLREFMFDGIDFFFAPDYNYIHGSNGWMDFTYF